MNDKQAQATINKIKNYIQRWAGPAGFGWWSIEVGFDPNTNQEDPQIIASTETLWEYRDAKIVFHLPICSTLTEKELEEAVVHEFCHILVASVQTTETEDARARTELAVTNVSKAMVALRNHFQKPTKKKKTK